MARPRMAAERPEAVGGCRVDLPIEGPTLSAHRGPRVIIAEDDEASRELLIRALESTGWSDVRGTGTGEDALAEWRKANEARVKSVVLLDEYMPGMNGLDVAEKILGQEPGQLVVLVSARLDEPVTRRARRIGVHACIAKGQVVRELPTMLTAWANERELL